MRRLQRNRYEILILSMFLGTHRNTSILQASNSRRVIISLACLTFLSFCLTISTYVHPPPGVFFAFVILNGIAQAAAGSYLQTSVIAVASLFGPTAIQAMMSGQAAIGVAVSSVEVLSAMASIRAAPTPEALAESKPEERSAFIFFGLSTLFLLLSAGAHMWLTSFPAYKAITEQFIHTAEHRRSTSLPSYEDALQSPLETQGLIVHEEKKTQLVRVAKANVVYNAAVAYVFIVTLVSPPTVFNIQFSLKFSRLCSRPSPSTSYQPIQRHILFSSAPCIFWSSTSETGSGATSARSPGCSFGPQSVCLPSRLHARCSSPSSSCVMFSDRPPPPPFHKPSSVPTSFTCSSCSSSA